MASRNYTILDVNGRAGFREWLSKNHGKADGCWVAVSYGEPEEGKFHYIDAVEEALCFGWIDSTKVKLDDGRNIQRFSPRKSSRFTELNKARCRRLIEMGLMTEFGLKVAPDLYEPLVIKDDIIDELKEDEEAWSNFCDFPELYRKIRIDNIESYRSQPEVFRKRLDKLKETSKKGVMYGNWDDYGRLN